MVNEDKLVSSPNPNKLLKEESPVDDVKVLKSLADRLCKAETEAAADDIADVAEVLFVVVVEVFVVDELESVVDVEIEGEVMVGIEGADIVGIERDEFCGKRLKRLLVKRTAQKTLKRFLFPIVKVMGMTHLFIPLQVPPMNISYKFARLSSTISRREVS